MGLFISNRLTVKQKAILVKYSYQGTGKYAVDNLTVEQAAKIIDELFEEARLNRDDFTPDYYAQN